MSQPVARLLSRKPLILLVAGEFLVLALLVVLIMQFRLGWTGAILIGLVAALFPVLFVRRSERYAEAGGNLSPAMRRYNRRMIAASVFYVAGLFAAAWIHERFNPGLAAQIGLAMLACAGVLLMVRAMWRLLAEETDEYQRVRHVRTALFGLGLVLVLASLWGFLEQFGAAPHVPGWAVVPVFGVGLGLSHCSEWIRP